MSHGEADWDGGTGLDEGPSMTGGLEQEEISCSNEENYPHSNKTDTQKLSHSKKRELLISTGQPMQSTQVC